MEQLTRDDLVQAVHNLNSFTRDGKLVWRRCKGPSTPLQGVLGIVNHNAYCTSYEGNILRFVKFSNYGQATGSNLEKRYRLQILNAEENRVLYEFPTVQGLADLCTTIEISIGGVENVIRSLAGKQ
jgi:hypothetical protein